MKKRVEAVVYTGRKCPWCAKVIQELANNNFKVEVIPIKLNREALTKLGKLGLNTVPQVFIEDVHIGGYEETKEFLKELQEV